MTITDQDRDLAEARMRDEAHPKAVAARYDRQVDRIVVSLDTGLELAFPPRMAQGLEAGTPADLSVIEISPSGSGLHWPRLDADLHVPGLIAGIFGGRRWMAAQLGTTGGRSRSKAKAAAARENGRKGGRPRKRA